MTIPPHIDEADPIAAGGPDGAPALSNASGGTGFVGSLARRLAAAPPAGLSPHAASLGSGRVARPDEEGGSGGAGSSLDGVGSLVSEADLGDLDLYAEHALFHIGLAALTGGNPAPARALMGLVPGPSPENGEGGSGAEKPDAQQGMEPAEQTANPATGSALPGGPDPGLPAGSSDVPPSPQ